MAFEKLKKVLRAIDRALEAESNKEFPREPAPPCYMTAAHLGMPVAPVLLLRDKQVNPTQLEFEKGGAIIEGAPGDVSAVRRFDNLAGRKLREASPEAWKSLEAHSEDLKEVFARVGARDADSRPVRALRYECARKTPGGRSVAVLTIPLGSS